MKQDARFKMQDSRFRTITYGFIFCIVFILSFHSVSYAASDYARGSGEEVFLSESPPSEHKSHKEKHRHAAGGEHSEHRAAPMKKFYLNTHSISDNAEVYIMHPDGKVVNAELKHEEDGLSITVDTRPMDFTMDGIFNVYVVNREVKDDALFVRVAKMNVINHSCGWGHKYKHDNERLRPKSLEIVPLEIVGNELWDENFHSWVMSGDKLKFKVLNNGKPAKDAKIKVKTQTNWIKTFKADDNGDASFQLIRDYYPEGWSLFEKRKRGSFLLTAEYEIDEKGEFNGAKYSKVKLISTMPWKYFSQRKEYTSYAYGLSIAGIFAVVSGLGVYIHRERRRSPYKEVMFNEKD